MGGDEFCVLAMTTGTEGAAIARRAASALNENGDAFAINSSYGVACLPDEASSAEGALHLADERMYEHKTSSASASRQSTDVLLTVLSEQTPTLLTHISVVTQLATMTAKRLGLPAHEVKRIELGASIIAVCDAFDAMTTQRPYSDAITGAAALAELQRCSGTQFNPNVVDAVLELIAQPTRSP